MRNTGMFLAAAGLAAFSTAAPAAELVTNGGFEAGPSGAFTAPQGWTVLPGSEIGNVAGSAYIPCCSVTGNAAQLANRFATFGPGDVANTSTLSQLLSTVSGANYVFSFDYGVLGGNTQTLFVRAFNGLTLLTSGTYTQGANNNLGTTFTSNTLNFIAGANPTRIEFQVDPFSSSVDGVLDNVSVLGAAAVPEPATWAMMILGFGFVGGAMRYWRRSMRVSFANA